MGVRSCSTRSWLRGERSGRSASAGIHSSEHSMDVAGLDDGAGEGSSGRGRVRGEFPAAGRVLGDCCGAGGGGGGMTTVVADACGWVCDDVGVADAGWEVCDCWGAGAGGGGLAAAAAGACG